MMPRHTTDGHTTMLTPHNPPLIPRSWLFWLIIALGLAWTIILGVQSPGTPLHDEITHYLIARDAWRDPVVILDVWGRPGNTLFYLLPSLVSLGARRWWAVLTIILTALLAARAASRLGVRQMWLVPLLLWLQPWYSQLGFTSITQIPFMLFLMLGVERWLAGKRAWASLAFGLLPIIRHEGIALTAVWIGYLVLRMIVVRFRPASMISPADGEYEREIARPYKSIIDLLPAFLPMTLWNLFYMLVYGRLASGNLFDLRPTDIYGSGDWFHFVLPTIGHVGPFIVLLAAFGFAWLVWQRRDVVYAVPAIAYFVTHTLIYRYGLFASGGYWLFLLPMAPTFALLAALGIEKALPRGASASLNLRRPYLPLVVIAALILNGVLVLAARPWPLQPNEIACEQAAAWLREQGEVETPIWSTHVWFFWIYDEPSLRRIPGGGFQPDPDGIPAGAFYLWDRNYGDLNGLTLDFLRSPGSGFTEVRRFEADELVLFQKR